MYCLSAVIDEEDYHDDHEDEEDEDKRFDDTSLGPIRSMLQKVCLRFIVLPSAQY